MLNELPEQTGPHAQSPCGVLKANPQLVQRETRQVSEFDMLELMPDVLLRIDFRRVRREVLYRHSSNSIQAAELFQLPALVDPGAVPHDEDVLRTAHQKMTKKHNRTVRSDRRLVDLRVQAALQRQPSDDGKVIVSVGRAQHGSLPRRSPGFRYRRSERKPRFVYENDRAVLKFGQFLGDRPIIRKPAREQRLILLGRPQYRFLIRPVLLMEQSGHMGGVVPNVKLPLDKPGYSGARPELANEAKAGCSSLQQSHETTDLLVRQTAPLAFTRLGAESFYTGLRSRLDPLAHSSLGNAECFSNTHMEANLVGEAPKPGCVGLPSTFVSPAYHVEPLNHASHGTIAPHDTGSRSLSYSCKGQ